MQPSGTYTATIQRQTAVGLPSTGKIAADFLVSLDGVAVSPVSLTEKGTVGVWTEYQFVLTLPSTARENVGFTIQPNGGTDIIAGGLISIQVENYDIDALAGLMLAQQGTITPTSAADGDLGDIVDGNSFNSGTLTIPLGRLSNFGISDISSGYTLTAKARYAPTLPATAVTGITVTITGALTIKLSWDTMPAALALATNPGGAASSLRWYVDVNVTETVMPTHVITVLRYGFNMVWPRNS